MDKKPHPPEECEDPRNDEAEALRLMKELHRDGGRQLTREEIIEHITRQFWMGYPVPKPPGKRGPKPKRTQYDDAYKRRKGLFHRLVRLPEARIRSGNRLRTHIDDIAKTLAPRVPRHTLAVRVFWKLQKRHMNADIKTIRTHLKKLGYYRAAGK